MAIAGSTPRRRHDGPLTSADYAAALAAAVDRRGYLRVPGRLIRLGGAQAESLMRSQRISNRRFRHVTGRAPRWHSAAVGFANLGF